LTAVILATLTLTTAGATRTRTADAKSTDWASSAKYWHGAALRQRHRADNLQRRLTVRVLQVRRQTRELKRLRSILARRVYPDAITAIRLVFGPYGEQAIRVSSCETGGTFDVNAQNGQYLGLFQMGTYARGRYGHSSTALGQAQAAYRYFVDSGRGWGPWECKP